jgi:hypothetical protein
MGFVIFDISVNRLEFMFIGPGFTNWIRLMETSVLSLVLMVCFYFIADNAPRAEGMDVCWRGEKMWIQTVTGWQGLLAWIPCWVVFRLTKTVELRISSEERNWPSPTATTRPACTRAA